MNFEQEKADALKALEEARKMVENSDGLFSLFVIASDKKGSVHAIMGDPILCAYSICNARKTRENVGILLDIATDGSMEDLVNELNNKEQ